MSVDDTVMWKGKLTRAGIEGRNGFADPTGGPQTAALAAGPSKPIAATSHGNSPARMTSSTFG